MLVLFVFLHGRWFISAPGDLDAFNFALGIRHFDVTQHRPHPPGAPVFIAAGKSVTWLWRSLALPADSLAGPEAAALGALSLITGSLSIVLVWLILRRFDGQSARAWRATLVVASAPLLWMIAARHLSDASGLLLVLATYLLIARGQLYLAAALAGIGMGLRIQTVLLTLPVLLVSLAGSHCRKTVVRASGWFAVGTMLWLLPLLVATQGPAQYWRALASQGEDDLSSSIILAGAPTLRNVANALLNTLVRPWGNWPLAAVILVAAAVGAGRLRRTSGRSAVVLWICAAPYALFHFVFHETATIRYALPIALGVAYLAAVAIESVPSSWRGAVTALLVGANLFVSVRAVESYSREGAPAMALLEAMLQRAAVRPPAFVTAHSTSMLDRIEQVLTHQPWRTVSPPEHYEWRGPIEHWTSGGTAPIWFVADPRRTDLALMDRRSKQLLGSFRLKAQATFILKGLRPNALNWWELRQPSWIAVKGFALTPETGGLAARDQQGPSFDGAVALIRRLPTGAMLAVGGRHLGDPHDAPVKVAIEVDGRVVTTAVATAQDRNYLSIVHLRPEQLMGDTPYATVTIRSRPLTPTASVVPVSVEQFDYQPADGMLFAFVSGWHEPELQADTGLTWRWASRRATLRVHGRSGTTPVLKLSGEVPATRRARSAQIRIMSGSRQLDAFSGTPGFVRKVTLPAAALDDGEEEIVIESTFAYVPHEEGRSPDRRELAFRLFDLDVVAVTESR